jgi:hypothetical protein
MSYVMRNKQRVTFFGCVDDRFSGLVQSGRPEPGRFIDPGFPGKVKTVGFTFPGFPEWPKQSVSRFRDFRNGQNSRFYVSGIPGMAKTVGFTFPGFPEWPKQSVLRFRNFRNGQNSRFYVFGISETAKTVDFAFSEFRNGQNGSFNLKLIHYILFILYGNEKHLSLFGNFALHL